MREPGGDLVRLLAERIDLAERGAALLLERREDHAPDRIVGVGRIDQAEIIRCHREAEDAAERVGGAPLVLGEIQEARETGGAADRVLQLPGDIVPARFWDVGPGGMPRRWQNGSVWDGSGSRLCARGRAGCGQFGLQRHRIGTPSSTGGVGSLTRANHDPRDLARIVVGRSLVEERPLPRRSPVPLRGQEAAEPETSIPRPQGSNRAVSTLEVCR
jgi:hypothetical protein